MTQPLNFEEWKKKHNVSDTSQLANNISKTHGGSADYLTKHLNDFLYTDYKLYLYRLQNPDFLNTDIPDNWEELIDMSLEINDPIHKCLINPKTTQSIMTEQIYKRPTYDEWSIENPINLDEDKGNYETIEDKHYAQYLYDCYLHRTSENHSAVISNIARFKRFAENKKFEWEDEEPTETYNITYDFDEWFSWMKDYKIELNSVFGFEIPENFENDLIEYNSKLKDYVDGFVLGPVGMYQGKSFDIKTYKADTFDEIVEHMKEVRQNNQMVFLFEASQKTKRLKEIVIDDITLPQDLSTFYKVRYGALNN